MDIKGPQKKILVSIIQAGTLAKISIIGSHGMQPGPKLRILRSSRNQKRRPLAPAEGTRGFLETAIPDPNRQSSSLTVEVM